MTAPEPVVIVPVPLPRSIYRVLVTQADEAGIQVGPLIARGLVRALRPRKKARRPRRSLSPELEAQIRDYHARGINDTAIARELGLSQPTVSRWRRELKLPTVAAASRTI